MHNKRSGKPVILGKRTEGTDSYHNPVDWRDLVEKILPYSKVNRLYPIALSRSPFNKSIRYGDDIDGVINDSLLAHIGVREARISLEKAIRYAM